ncbi:MAG: butyrate kinase [Bacteroidales bacterium]|nr:butyrate kinase [Bacteroidales bacterium]MDD2425317.1 butyrate kinase [Bacteroidales bacterium]MDD3989379.1 butyrate kinase [Bacteroidales bacterium]
MPYRILAINPGSTSTKISVFEDEKVLFTETLRHTNEELSPYKQVADQFEFRKRTIISSLEKHNINLGSISIIVGRGGLLRPVESGVYQVNERMKEDLIHPKMGEHASNLGGLIASDLASVIGCMACIADPVVVDELEQVARITGLPQIERVSIFHALNHKAIAKIYARECKREYADLNLIVVHLGGGVSIGAHKNGRVIDVNNALNGEGPFSPERAGSLPAAALAELCYSGQYTLGEVKKMITGEGGLVAHLGTNSFYEVSQRIEKGDKRAELLSEAFAYNVSKAIGAAAAVLSGKVDAILLTGGIANNKSLMDQIASRVEFIASVKVYPGEDEMAALAMNGLAVLKGEESPKLY